MSLVMMAIARRLALIFSAGRPIPLGDGGDALVDFGSSFLFGLPQPVILMFAIFFVGGIVLNFTSIITAIGSNEEAVRLSGIALPRYILAVYVISGALAGLAGIVSTSRTGVGSAQVGVGAELDVIAAVAIGGASLMGGRGGMINTLLGALVTGIIANIINRAGVPGYNQNVYMGLIIHLAMLIQYGAGPVKRRGHGRDLTLSIDIGTGSVRAALLDSEGAILHIAGREHDQIVPQFGWAEQKPHDWWTGVSASIRDALGAVEGAQERIAAVSACGQMHGVVLIDEAGRVTRDAAPLWNDKRTAAIVADFVREHAVSAYLAESGNPPTPAWPGFKLMWLMRNDPDACPAARAVLMPKD